MCVFLLVCVSMCQYVLSSLCLLVASVLASMRWLLCGGDGSKKTITTSVITKKNPAKEFFHYGFKLKTASNYSHYSFELIRKKLNLHHVKSVIILTKMVSQIAVPWSGKRRTRVQEALCTRKFTGTQKRTRRAQAMQTLKSKSQAVSVGITGGRRRETRT